MRHLLAWDGERLSTDVGAGRSFRPDPRCVAGPGVAGAWASVCASPDPAARVPFDDSAVQDARRDALAWWFALLGDDLVCCTTLALDGSTYGGAVTVARSPALLGADPFARVFAATVVRTDLLAAVPPPCGPVLERYAGEAWPGGSF